MKILLSRALGMDASLTIIGASMVSTALHAETAAPATEPKRAIAQALSGFFENLHRQQV